MTYAHGIDGQNIVGEYGSALGPEHGFLYDGETWTTFDSPRGDQTSAYDIDGDRIVGDYRHFGINGFLIDGAAWTMLRYSGANTYLHGIDGSNIVGYAGIPVYRSLLYDGATWNLLDFPGAEGTWAYGIDGDRIVGWYSDGEMSHGFIYTIPEPATLLLLTLGCPTLMRRRS